ncbi:polyribonucleotide nucleotidyltransferase [soil metagenome]
MNDNIAGRTNQDNLPEIVEERVEIGGRDLVFEVGRLAGLADGAVTVHYGDTLVLSTAQSSSEPREGIDFFPLTVDYEERMFAAGKIPGGFIKREGRPSEHAVLSARLTDRPIRPLFPKGFRNDVQLITTVFSTDQQNDPDILSINGASTALTISSIPFQGPVAGVRMGYADGQLIVNPTHDQIVSGQMAIVVAGTADAIMMVEGEGSEVSEAILVDAIAKAHDEIKKIVQAQLRLQERVGKVKKEFTPPAKDETFGAAIRDFIGDRLDSALYNADKAARSEATDALKREVVTHFVAPAEQAGQDAGAAKKAYGNAFDDLVKERVRNAILKENYRPDGRTPTEIRPIWSQVGFLPRTHGSAIFTRGQTQVVSVATLGSTKEDQMLDNISLETSKRYMHHYNFPPYSVGEARFMRGPSRRDIGHGALAERALVPVLPKQEDFPYVLRVVSEVVSSNGSSSMASVCGSTLSLLDAGVPIKAMVAGVAMGLVTDGDGNYTILTDIQGMEDFLGDMDFKVAGTREGITAIQMDIKVRGITADIMREALDRAHEGRMHILSRMEETTSSPREVRSEFAPSIEVVKIKSDQIGAVIGPGGKNIRAIQELSGAKIDIEEDGTIYVSAVGHEATSLAIEEIRRITYVPNVGDKLHGKVKTIIPVGAFVEIAPGKDGFVHISQLTHQRLERVEDAVSVGDEVDVVVTEIRPDGKINLSRRALLPQEAPAGDQGGGSSNGGGSSGGGQRGSTPQQSDRDRSPRPQQASGGRRPGYVADRPESRESGKSLDAGRPRDSRRPPSSDN